MSIHKSLWRDYSKLLYIETFNRNSNTLKVRIVKEELHIYFIKVTKKLKAYGCVETGC
jgi:hypothetical protein